MSADQVDGVHPSDQNILLQDPMRAWDRISDAGLYGTWARGTVEFPNGGHLQGIQRGVAGDRPYLVLSGSSDTESYFVTLVFDSDKEAALSEQSAESVHYTTISKDPLRHAGGIQLIGDILVVGAEDNEGKNHSAVFFYDLSNPRVPKELKVKVELPVRWVLSNRRIVTFWRWRPGMQIQSTFILPTGCRFAMKAFSLIL
jgi:hypothetical protein